jgi:hypothetical protein
MITRKVAADTIIKYLNHEMTLEKLVDWAETSLIDTRFEPDADTEHLMNVLTYLAAGDTPDFPLTWEVLSEFLDKLGVSVRVMAA